MVLALARPTSGVSGRRWRLRGRFPDGEMEGVPYQALVLHLLWHRGVRTQAEAAAFMEAGDPGHDVALLPDIDAAIGRMRRALDQGELIATYGDFDVDGVTASAILIEGLRDLGGNVTHYIPDRFAEGYGVHKTAIQHLAEQGASLIVTADCGTGAVAEVEVARRLGVDVIVLDHHSTPPELPAACALVNPKRDGNRYPEPELASGGLAFRVMQALYESLRRPFEEARYLDLVALSTVCDMAPLRGENRWLVHQGLAALRKTSRPGLRALLESSGCDPGRVDAGTIGFTLGPRINAAGRLAHADLALDLLLEQDEDRARDSAIELGALNQQRQQMTAAAVELAGSLLLEEDRAGPLIFVGHSDISSGIVGLVASRLVDEYRRPAVVYQQEEETSRASCRSIAEFDITAALRTCPGLMVRFGGHSAAAGFTALNENLPALKEALVRQAEEELHGVDLTPSIDIDAAISLRHVDGRLIRDLAGMAPFGVGNPEPTFLSRDVEVADARVMGEDGRHLRLTLRDGRKSWPAVAFSVAESARPGGEHAVEAGQRLDVVYTFSAGRGMDGALELRITDFAQTQTGRPGDRPVAPSAG